MDAEFKKLLAGSAWADTGDRVDPSAVTGVTRAGGWSESFSTTDDPPRTLFNQMFRELYGGAKEVGLGISQYDAEVSYPIGAICQVNGTLFYAKLASDSTNPVNPLTLNNTTWEEMGGIGEIPTAPPAIAVGDIQIDGSLANQFVVYWVEPDNGGSAITSVDLRYSKNAAFPSASTTTITDYSAGTPIPISNRDSDLYYVSLRFNNSISDSAGNAQWSAGRQVLASPLTPDAVTGLRAVGNIGDGIVDLDWGAPYARGLTISDYLVEWKSGAQDYDSTRQATSTATSRRITGLTNSTAYTFRVTARSNRSTSSPPSNEATATPEKNPDVPDAPSIQGEALDQGTITALVSTLGADNNSTITAFEWQLKRAGNSWDTPSNITSQVISDAAVTFSGLISNNTYNIRCRAYNGVDDADDDPDTGTAGYGAFSSEISINTPPFTSPDAPVLSLRRDLQGRLYYALASNIDDNGGSDVASYDVEYKASDATDWIELHDLTSPEGLITGLDTAKAYDVQMRATNTTQSSPWGSASIAAVATVPSKPVVYLHEGEIQYQSGGSPTSIARHVYGTAVSDSDGGKPITRWEFRSTSSVSGSLDNDYIHSKPVGNVGFALRTRTMRVQGRVYNGVGDTDNNPDVGNAGWSEWSDVTQVTIT